MKNLPKLQNPTSQTVEEYPIQLNIENFLLEKGWDSWEDVENELHRIEEESFDLMYPIITDWYDNPRGDRFEEIHGIDAGKLWVYFNR